MQENRPQSIEVDRRTVLKWGTALGGLGVLGGGAGVLTPAAPAAAAAAAAGAKIITQSCMVNCGSRCVVKAHVVDGKIVRMSTDDSGSDEYGNHQIRACLRGRALRQRVYAPDRLKYPMIRTGVRGEAKFRRASWDEALDLIATKLKDVKARYGNESIYLHYATGQLGGTVSKSWPPGQSAIARLMNCYGGYLNHYNTYSTAQITTAMPYLYGAGFGQAIADMANSKLVVMFGNNPAATRMSGAGIVNDLVRVREKANFPLIVIDPFFTDTAALADEWIPIRPGTDAALCAAIAHVLITENKVDQAFLDKYCVGYDDAHLPDGIPANSSYKSYILGLGPDRQAKTPAWASKITAIPVERIVKLAHQIADARPCCINQGWGPQRHGNGEDTARAIAMLAILTGNVGISGGGSGARESGYGLPLQTLPVLTNPIKDSISFFLWTDAILRGQEMTAARDGVRGVDKLKSPIKFIWNYAGNSLINQHSDVNKTAEILRDDKKCEMIVVIDNHMTASARFADVLLPGTTNFEENDFTVSSFVSEMAFVAFTQQAIEPMFECRDVYTICADLARRLGVGDKFTEGKTRDQWLQLILDKSREKVPGLPKTLDDAWAMGIYKAKNPGAPFVAYKAFRDNPDANKLATPSGKIEVFSKRLWDINKTWQLPKGERIPAIPEYTPDFDNHTDPKTKKYPLQMVDFHYKQRTHSTWGNVPWVKEAAPQQLWINPIDAKARKIRHGDAVKVFNEHGISVSKAKVTERVMPGVVLLPQGAWYQRDGKKGDKGGCSNVLTTHRPSPLAKGNPQHSVLVQVARA
jgi:anaerobic dimethyl sulfoxide reductase subunit A